ncbi:hypothetical protein, partial [Klebsiella quasipneumoniae]|uniref:hypothetical protein n=1 Tax=Klebsiella quasipneumoniae TaxID=1463165 RepID=UPI00292B9D8A
FVHGGDLWRFNTPLSCLQPPQQGKTHKCTVNLAGDPPSVCARIHRVAIAADEKNGDFVAASAGRQAKKNRLQRGGYHGYSSWCR